MSSILLKQVNFSTVFKTGVQTDYVFVFEEGMKSDFSEQCLSEFFGFTEQRFLVDDFETDFKFTAIMNGTSNFSECS